MSNRGLACSRALALPALATDLIGRASIIDGDTIEIHGTHRPPVKTRVVLRFRMHRFISGLPLRDQLRPLRRCQPPRARQDY